MSYESAPSIQAASPLHRTPTSTVSARSTKLLSAIWAVGACRSLGAALLMCRIFMAFSALRNIKLVPPTVNGFACIAVFGPALRLLTFPHFAASPYCLDREKFLFTYAPLIGPHVWLQGEHRWQR